MNPFNPLTGPKVLAIFLAAFGIVIAVNLVMARQAIATFPGLEVANSYVASQTFDTDRSAQAALGWRAAAGFERGLLTIAFRTEGGHPAPVAALEATVGRPTHARDDVTPEFDYLAGRFEAPVALAPGLWHVRVRATAIDGTEFRQRLTLSVREGAQ